jgi:glutamate formiminotransferase/formiminotetrahydrofolate cyclodeaminase
MVANLTIGKKGYEDAWDVLRPVADAAQAAKDFFLDAIDRDTDAFNAVMAAMRVRARTDEEKAAKVAAVEAATRGAILVPLSVLERTLATVALAAEAAARGNQSSLSDAGVATLVAQAAARGAYYNVLINLDGVSDSVWRHETRARAQSLLEQVDTAAARVVRVVEERLMPETETARP